jgi:hypothetical protein
MTGALSRVLLMTAATAGCLAVLSCPALAGSYTISACSPSTSPGLWARTNTFPASFTAANNCGGPSGSEKGPLDGSNQGALYAEDVLNSPANIPNGSKAGWTFTAPAGTTITAVSYYRTLTAYNDPDISSGLFVADATALEQCNIDTAFGTTNTCSKVNDQAPVAFGNLSTSNLFLGVTCRIVRPVLSCGAGGAPLHAATASMYSARVTLAENSLPALGTPAGPLWGGGVVSGIVPVTFAASDATGIPQSYVRADAGGPLIGATQTCDFTLAAPCPQLPDGSLSVDTRRVGDGPHTFSVVVVDAAGNSQAATSPTVTVRNHAATPPPPPGVPGTQPPGTSPTRTKINAVISGRRLRVSGSIARTGRVTVSWRSKLHARTLAHGSRRVTIHAHKVTATFMLSTRARKGTTRIAVRSGRRIVAQARARRG